MEEKAFYIQDEDTLIDHVGSEFAKRFDKGSSVLIKLHMGEPGNKHYIKAAFTKRIIDVLLEKEMRPFLFDTPVVYASPRNNPGDYLRSAEKHGYSEERLGIPVVISDESVKIKGDIMQYGVAADTLNCDVVFLLSHFKGHICSGMGGAIKNVGMGCMSKETKGSIHGGGEPRYVDGCVECGICVENCPTQNIRLDKNRPWFDVTWCPGCSNCVLSCPEKCIVPKKDVFGRLLAEAAVTAHSHFKNVFAVNVLKGITQLCDCIADSGPVVAEDIGYVVADDMLSADIASLVLLKDRTGREDIFSEYNKVSSWGHVTASASLMGRTMEVEIENI